MATAGGPVRGGTSRRRPSQVLGLPQDGVTDASGPGPGWAPPAREAPAAATAPRRTRRVVALLVGLLVMVLVVTGLGRTLGDPVSTDGTDVPQLVTDIATEDAVVALLQVFSAEIALTQAAAADAGVFALPGPTGRAAALRTAVAQARETVEEVRAAGVAEGTPGRTYALDGDHDALLSAAVDLTELTDDVATLNDLHVTLLTGTGTADLRDADAVLGELAARRQGGPLSAWAQSLRGVLSGDGTAVASAEALRASAGEQWRTEADLLAPAALQPLTAFLNGVDPGVLASLDGHPVAGPALGMLRR